jgi:phosphoribosylaminoimidazolecarboxamide formyltransferase/IMP cyclohydrolase
LKGNLKIKRALISLSDKEGVVELCTSLIEFGVEIFSSDGTKKFLESRGISVKSISEITDLPALLGGRVKTLHPFIHAAILADKRSILHTNELLERNIQPFDLVVVNFYPFEKAANNNSGDESEITEYIDIGGPTMVRSAAKNFQNIAVLSSKEQYSFLIEELKSNNGAVSIETRRKLASDAFQRIVEYDIAISNYFNGKDVFNLSSKKTLSLRYGENPHQTAALYGGFSESFKQIHGKELSYNNILDINAAVDLIDDLAENSCAIIKHNNPCGVATGDSGLEAYEKALNCDHISAFGGIAAFNSMIDTETAKKLNEIFLEVVILPSINDEVKNLLSIKKDRRIILYKKKIYDSGFEYRSVRNGTLIQTRNEILYDSNSLKVVTDIYPSESEMDDMLFAWRIVKHVKSNAIVYVKNKSTIGIGAGQMSRIDSARIAKMKAIQFNHDTKNCVAASDAFFPFADGLEEVISVGAAAVIQPGGSIRDREVIDAANRNNISMVFTNVRHFKH